jgi:hypothetical protein
MLVFADLMPDCRLEVSLHWVGPATGQREHGVPWFSLVSRANAELVPKFHVALHASHGSIGNLTLH